MQQKLGVVIGKDYPEPIVDHKIISKSNMGRMKEAYDAHKAGAVPASKANGSSRTAGSSDTGTSSSKRRKT
jgi:cryptochrome